MAAYWHLHIPTEVTVTINKTDYDNLMSQNKSVLPKPFDEDFIKTKSKEYTEEYPVLGVRQKIDFIYRLSDKTSLQLKPFIKEAWGIIAAEKPMALADGLADFIDNHFNSLNISKLSYNELDKKLDEINNNYFFRTKSIADFFVYYGWPDLLKSDIINYGLNGFSIFMSYEKLNLIPEETVFFYNINEKIKKQLSEKYSIAKYLYTVGF